MTRSQAVARAQDWVNKAVPYSPNGRTSPYGWWSDTETGGRYRQDCSGLVSMAWQLPDSLTTNSLPDVSTRISIDSLQPGDALNNITTHTVLFTGWADSSHYTANIIEEWGRSGPTRARTMDRSEMSSRGFLAYRYDQIAADAPAPGPTPASRTKGQFFHGTRNADGTWTTLGALAGVGSAPQFNGYGESIAAAPDGSAQVVGVGLDGNIYHTVRYISGGWQPWGPLNDNSGHQMAASQVSIAVGPDNTAQVLAVGADNALYHEIRRPDGTWTGFQPLTSSNGTAMQALDVSIAANPDGSAQILVIGADGRVYHEIRRADGTWTGLTPISGVGTPDVYATNAAITITPDGTAQILVTGGR